MSCLDRGGSLVSFGTWTRLDIVMSGLRYQFGLGMLHRSRPLARAIPQTEDEETRHATVVMVGATRSCTTHDQGLYISDDCGGRGLAAILAAFCSLACIASKMPDKHYDRARIIMLIMIMLAILNLTYKHVNSSNTSQ